LRYFLYVSDSKLDMLFGQIEPSLLRRISVEAKVDLKLAAVTLRNAQDREPVRMAKLRIVERYLEQNNQIGTIERPGDDYFHGQMEMRWGWLADNPGDRLPIVFFRGLRGSHLVLLAGSRRHVLGEAQDSQSEAPAWSALPNIMATVGERISELPELGEWIRSIRADAEKYARYPSEEVAAVFDGPEAGLTAAADTFPSSPLQLMDFLAVPLAEGTLSRVLDRGASSRGLARELNDVHAILGSPLYVAHSRRIATVAGPTPEDP
jgi:hypothetical protein